MLLQRGALDRSGRAVLGCRVLCLICVGWRVARVRWRLWWRVLCVTVVCGVCAGGRGASSAVVCVGFRKSKSLSFDLRSPEDEIWKAKN